MARFSRLSHFAPARAIAAPAALLALLLAGCAPTLPVVVAPVACPDPGTVLTQRCSAPQAIPDSATYGAVLELHQADRKALRDCADRHAALVQAAMNCQKAVQDYNASLVEVNRRIANKP
jgi:hypothetical protein